MRRPAPMPTVQTGHLPAPVGGLNTIGAGNALPQTDCIQCVNLVSGEHGLRTRLGSRVYGPAGPGDVGTLLPYTGTSELQDRLFFADALGIWDSDSLGAPVVPFPLQSGQAGQGIHHAMVTAGGHFLLYCDEENGYHVYSETSGTWAAVAMGGGGSEISGVDPSDFCFVMVWKSRVWFVEKGTTNVWYLAAGSIYGAATKLNLDRSAQFRQGGELVGLWNWTLDGGVGIDDFLVAVGRGGDVAVYQGSDPASASTFSLRGTWNAGAFPAGRRIATPFGGDLLLLSKSGIRPLSQLVSGGDGAGVYSTAKISNYFSEVMQSRSELSGWGLYLHPEDNALLVTVPIIPGEEPQQLVMALWNRSWSLYRGLHIRTAGVWRKKLYFGTDHYNDRTLLLSNDGYVDDVDDDGNFTPISWNVLTAFQNLQNANQKQLVMIRPLLLSNTRAPTVQSEARYTYNLDEVGTVPAEQATGGAWDVGYWDVTMWEGEPVPSVRVRGAVGMGVDFAIAIKGTATARVTLVGIDVAWKQGGFL